MNDRNFVITQRILYKVSLIYGVVENSFCKMMNLGKVRIITFNDLSSQKIFYNK